MKLKNKKTGEIVIANVTRIVSGVDFDCGQTLADLNAEWEDAPEEPKVYWCVNGNAEIISMHIDWESPETTEACKQIGNYFETPEEAELAVRKLKAWKRLKDKGFRFDSWDENHHNLGIIEFSFSDVKKSVYDFEKDLDLLFCTGGGE